MGAINIPDTAEFVLDADDSIKFETQTNGDKLTIFAHLDRDVAAILAYLANCKGCPIHIELRKVV